MNPQISFIMSEQDEKDFLNFVHENDCVLLKRVLLNGEFPDELYECTDIYSSAYYIVSKDFKSYDAYVVTEIDGQFVRVLFPNDDSDEVFLARPMIEFNRGRLNVGIGRLYVNAAMLNLKEKEFVKCKYKAFQKWIINNSNYSVKNGIFKVFLLPGATKEFFKNGAVFPW